MTLDLAALPQAKSRRRKGVASAAARGRAFIYVRCSTEAQVDETGTLDSQEAACRALCSARAFDVAAVYVDAGESGGKLERPALTAMRAAVAAGDGSVVVVYALDRLSRSQRDTLALLDEFESAGAGLMAASQSFDTASPAGKALLGMLAVFAELQRDEIRARTRRALAAKSARGEAVGRTPFGLVRDGSGFARCSTTWPTVERILRERASGVTCEAIAASLNADHVPTATAAKGERRGLVDGPGQWSYGQVAKLCRNPRILNAASQPAAVGEAA